MTELLVLPPPLTAEMTGMHQHARFWAVLATKSRASCVLEKHPASRLGRWLILPSILFAWLFVIAEARVKLPL